MNVSLSNTPHPIGAMPSREEMGIAREQQYLDQLGRFDTLSDAACAALDEAPEAAPALGLLLRLAEEGVPAQDLAALDESLIERAEQLRDERPDLVRFWLAGLPSRLANRKPWQTVQDVCNASLTRQALRDLDRSLDRTTASAAESPDYGVSWYTYFLNWREQVVDLMGRFMLLGSGHSANRRESDFIAPYDATRLTPLDRITPRSCTPLPDFSRAGKSGYLVALLYGLAAVQRIAPSENVACLPRDDADSASVLSHLSQIMANGWDAFVETTSYVHGLAQHALDTAVTLDPLRMPEAAAQWPTAIHADRAKQARIPAAPVPPAKLAFNATSPALQRLFDIANLWRHRAALHQGQQMSSGPLLAFAPPPSEASVFDTLLSETAIPQGESAAFLRRISPNAPDSRVQRVEYHTLDQAARLIRSGELNILEPDSGISYDIGPRTDPGAIFMAPGVMGAAGFARLVAEWRARCDARASITWRPPDTLTALVNSTDTDFVPRDIALRDLSIAYEAGLISHRAVRLGRNSLLPASALPTGPVAVNVYPLQFSLQRDGATKSAVPAGTFVLCEQPKAGATLLFMMGEPLAWREFASPQALIDAVGQNRDGLRDTLHMRLPRAFQVSIELQASSFELAPLATLAPMAVAANATLAVIAAEVPLRAAQAQTQERIDQYRDWIDGASTGDLEHALRQAKRPLGTGDPPSTTHGLVWTASDISSIEHYQELRGNMSFTLPEPREIARQYVKSILTKNNVMLLDPDELLVQLGVQSQPVRLPDAVIRKAQNPTKLPVGQLLRRRDDKSLEPWPPAHAAYNRDVNGPMLMDQFSTPEYVRLVNGAFDALWREHFHAMRQMLKGEFIAQCWLANESGAFSADVMEIARRVVGPIELGRLNRDALQSRVPTANVQREWLRVQGHESSLMAISISGKPAVLLLAGYADGLRVHGFDHRDALTTWFSAQTQITAERQRLAGAISSASAMPSYDLWLKDANINLQGIKVPSDTGTFTALTQSYRTKYSRSLQLIPHSQPQRKIIHLMHFLAQLDLLVGMGTWADPELRPLSATLAMVDAGAAAVGLSVGWATGDAALRRQGWQSLAAAIGSQGLASVHFKAQAILTRDPKYMFFVDAPPVAQEYLIPGLHRSGQRLYAAIDARTRAYLTFDEATGFFRAVRVDNSVRVPQTGPLMRLSPSGRWHTIVASVDLPAPPLEDPHIGWQIDQHFLRRYDRLRRMRAPVFDEARRANAALAAEPALPVTLSTLRLHKLEFLDPSIRDLGELGAMARRIDAEQNMLDAAQDVAFSPLRQRAAAEGARCFPLAQRPHAYVSHIRSGLTRITALNAHTRTIESMPAWFNEIARASPAASASFMADLSHAGTIDDALISTETSTIPLADLENIFGTSEGTYRAFQIRAGTRTMLIGRRPYGTQPPTYFFMDPNDAMVTTTQWDRLVSMAREHLETKSVDYQMATQGSPPLVAISEIDLRRLANAPLTRDGDVIVPLREAFE